MEIRIVGSVLMIGDGLLGAFLWQLDPGRHSVFSVCRADWRMEHPRSSCHRGRFYIAWNRSFHRAWVYGRARTQPSGGWLSCNRIDALLVLLSALDEYFA